MEHRAAVLSSSTKRAGRCVHFFHPLALDAVRLHCHQFRNILRTYIGQAFSMEIVAMQSEAGKCHLYFFVGCIGEQIDLGRVRRAHIESIDIAQG